MRLAERAGGMKGATAMGLAERFGGLKGDIHDAPR
jgi:hypothetical protein